MSTATDSATGEWFDGMAAWGRAQRLLFVCFGIGFVLLVAAGPVTWWLLRPALTASSVPLPAWQFETFRRGEYADQLERYLRESSWVTFELRGLFNESLWRLGVLETDRVVFGRDGWMFLPETLKWRPAVLESTRARRLAMLGQAKQFAADHGMHLLVLPVPNKVTIYADYLQAGTPVPAGRERLYGEILADLDAAGIPRLDLRALLSEHRAAHPDELLYDQRGTHWQLAGELLVASAVQRRLEQEGWLDLVRSDPDIVVKAPRSRLCVPGLVHQLGFRCEAADDASPSSAVVEQLMETVSWRPTMLRNAAGGLVEIPRRQPTAAIVLCGTSFSQAWGWTLVGTLKAPVDQRCVIAGGGSFRGIRTLHGELGKDGFAPKILLWEFVERDYQINWTVEHDLFPPPK